MSDGNQIYRTLGPIGRLTRWILILPLALTGCASSSLQPTRIHREPPVPVQKLADYQAISCSGIWNRHGQSQENNPLYWLRAIDCAEGLSPVKARAEAARYPDNTWQDAFRRSILLGKARITPVERAQQIDALDAAFNSVPRGQRPLYQLWRDAQANEYALSQERSHYAALQQSSDKQLDTLRHEQQLVQQQLEQTERKLKYLTDIERQLSSRKSSVLEGHSVVPESGQHAVDDAEDVSKGEQP